MQLTRSLSSCAWSSAHRGNDVTMIRISTPGSDVLAFLVDRLGVSSSSPSGLAASPRLFFSDASAARFPPKGVPGLEFLFFSFSYSAMSGAIFCSMSLALAFALLPPVEVASGTSFSLPDTLRDLIGVATAFASPSLASVTPFFLPTRPITTPSAGPFGYALSSAASKIFLFLLASGDSFFPPPG